MSMMGRSALIAGLAGLALFLVMFLPWFGSPDPAAELAEDAREAAEFFGVDPGSGGAEETTESGWSSMGWFGVTVLLLAAIAAVGYALVQYTGASISAPVALSTIACGLGVIAFVIVLFRLLFPPGGGEVDREIGVYLGLVTTAAITVGGYLGMQEEGRPLGALGDTAGHPGGAGDDRHHRVHPDR
jgi:hypothetical protein